MKNILMLVMMMVSFIAFSQDKENSPVYTIENNMVKATYFHDNGAVAQTGFYLNGKPHGEWKAYDEQGKKVALGNYDEGQKVGKWFFWKNETLSEVNYEDSRIASVTEWKSANPVVINND
ncbi:toxin-antitoxin system YwqK family antitoxin [Robertkochia solimangrovi]|uniref:toxin-antitoxin system YwqK family antitoxin n=1 Tax=Robertkochia solimangrovi TaxID=2213046 RepID=UPI00117C4C80|nr:nicotinic acid mononucleotide adenyltransferase [Robertkochia solimangrovi]TRZ45921.1 nicotinic acid mononucleotide adenyltransferase [Robertkochia solimangrovi]